MALRENPTYLEIYNSLVTLLPLQKTERINDLNHLLELKNSFALFSIPRNGTTTLLKHFSNKVEGIYKDAMRLKKNSAIMELEEVLTYVHQHFVLDEVGAFIGRVGNYEKAMAYLQEKSKTRPIGLRFHLNYPRLNLHYDFMKEDLQDRGFEIIDLGKISYAQLRDILDPLFAKISFSFPDKFIAYAYEHYDGLAQLTSYIGETFKFLIEQPNLELDESFVHHYCQKRYPFIF